MSLYTASAGRPANTGILTRFGMACALAGALAAASAPDVAAQTAPSIEALKALLDAQQRQLDAVKAALAQAQKQAADAAAAAAAAQAQARTATESSAGKGFLDSIEVGGVVEIEATDSRDFAKTDSSDITLAKVELFLDARPADYVSTHVQLIYEDGGSEVVSLDEAIVTLGDPEAFPAYLQAGKWVMPFGGFDTQMSTDPLTKNLGETKEAAVLVGVAQGGFNAEGFVFNGDSQRSGRGNHIDQFGLSAAFETETDDTTVRVGAGYVNNIADSDGLSDGLGAGAGMLANYVGGAAVHGAVGHGGFMVYGGYMTALRSFQAGELAFRGRGARPAAWNLEAAFTTQILGRETVFAGTVQGTEEAVALGLPERRVGGAVTVGVLENTSVTVEYLHDTDYGTGDGGTGNTGHTGTVKLAAEF